MWQLQMQKKVRLHFVDYVDTKIWIWSNDYCLYLTSISIRNEIKERQEALWTLTNIWFVEIRTFKSFMLFMRYFQFSASDKISV